MKDIVYRSRCPDCGCRLSKSGTSGKLLCLNAECSVVYVTYGRGKHSREIIRITRAARARVWR